MPAIPADASGFHLATIFSGGPFLFGPTVAQARGNSPIMDPNNAGYEQPVGGYQDSSSILGSFKTAFLKSTGALTSAFSVLIPGGAAVTALDQGAVSATQIVQKGGEALADGITSTFRVTKWIVIAAVVFVAIVAAVQIRKALE